ncbi:MAG: M61 family metallopeptidase [Pseudonocardiaceae bacterium]
MGRKLALLLSLFSILIPTLTLTADESARPSGTHPAGRAITLTVDATEAPRKLFRAQEVIPADPGPLTLYYPKWIPGEHGPTGPISNLSGLTFTANGKTLPWRRDPVDMYAFHLDVPHGASVVEASLEYLAPTFAGALSSSSSTTSHLAVFSWNWILLYPAAERTDELLFDASLRLPPGWKSGTGLTTERESGDEVHFRTASLTTLVDSPVLAGEHFRVIPLSTANPVVEMKIAADSPAALEASPQFTGTMRKLVDETRALFGAEHYERYTFLLTLSDHVARFGLEHHQSNDSRVSERALIDEAQGRLALGVLPHEYFHSWNGKYRRPAGLATSNPQTPMQGEMLWIYEGLTQYYGNVLAVRSGLWTPENYVDALAQAAAGLDHTPGRRWRPLIDTAVAAQLLYEAPAEWSAERRGTDFYNEGWLLWLEADTLIRTLTSGQRSLDDFCRRFHGGQSGPPEVKPYTFDDVVATLNEVAPYDWRAFLDQRLHSTDSHAPLGGIDNGGWRLTYDAVQGQRIKDVEALRERIEMGYSLGLRLDTEGLITDVIPGTPAAAAKLGPGMTVVAVEGTAFSSEALRVAVSAAKTSTKPMQLLVNNEGTLISYPIDYHGGERYPHLVREGAKPDLLSQTITPLTPGR